eukprot:13922793-Alexandrium_andersonii.AAC.1
MPTTQAVPGDFGVPEMDWSISPDGLHELWGACWRRLGSGLNQVGTDHLFGNCPRLRAHRCDLSPELRKVALQCCLEGHI